ncbi:FecCD family ABC transporter permease [Rhodococcus phenolicus]|uniref:FecCD family ABC transporter permease n=1 Tax=Rhodococcus phenolicus TaxID=263849 RepID=UPI000B110501
MEPRQLIVTDAEVRSVENERVPIAAVVTAVGLVVLALSVAVTVTIGPADLSVADVYSVIFDKLGVGESTISAIREGIVWELRLPRTLLAAICGAGLAVCGVIMQSLLRNPLADPFVLGISSGASTGAVMIAVLGIGGGAVSLSGGAFLGALVSFGLVLLLATGAGGGTSRVVLAGVAGTQLFSALTSFIVISSADAERTRGVLFWLLGSLAGATWSDVILCGVVCAAGVAVCLLKASALDAFTFGSSTAATLGIAVGRTRLMFLVVTALITAVLVSAAGAIGFVGLVLPHAARFLVGPRHSRLVPVAAVVGAVFMVWVDAVARTVFAPQEVPVGVVTALIGVPAFALILFRMRGTQ